LRIEKVIDGRGLPLLLGLINVAQAFFAGHVSGAHAAGGALGSDDIIDPQDHDRCISGGVYCLLSDTEGLNDIVGEHVLDLPGEDVDTGVLLARRAPEPTHSRHAAASGPWWREILNVLDREIILASVLSFASHVTFPAVASFLVLYAQEIGIKNIGWFYVATGTTSLIARPMLGKVSDRIGRRRALLACFVFQAVALMTLAFATNLIALIIPGTLYMLGLAMASATTLAIAMEQAKPERRGRAMATFSIALPLSNGVGALICGGLVQWIGYVWMYLVLACIATGGLVVTIANRSHLK